MIIVCPDCSARYLVPATAFASGPRAVKCARCSHIWKADLPPEVSAISPEEAMPENIAQETASEATSEQKTPSEKTSSEKKASAVPSGNLPVLWKNPVFKKIKKGLKISFYILLVISSVWFVEARQDLATTWPSLEKVYGLMGYTIYHVGDGLRFIQVRSEKRYEDGQMKLFVEGQIYNQSGIEQPVPQIKITAFGPDGKESQSWSVNPSVPLLPSKKAISFDTSSEIGEGAITEINLSFVGEKKKAEDHGASE